MGDREAGDRLLRRHIRVLRRYLAARGVDDIDEVVQETLIAVTRNRERAASRRTFRAYLLVAARGKAIDAARWRARHDRGVAGTCPATRETADPLVVDEGARAMADVLASLPDTLSVPLAGYFLDERTAADLAHGLGVPQGTVRTRVRRALQLIRDRVDRTTSPEGLAAGVERWATTG